MGEGCRLVQEGYPTTRCRVLRWPRGDRGTSLCFGPQLSCPGVQGSSGSWGGASCLPQHHSEEGVPPRSLASQALVFSVLLSIWLSRRKELTEQEDCLCSISALQGSNESLYFNFMLTE